MPVKKTLPIKVPVRLVDVSDIVLADDPIDPKLDLSQTTILVHGPRKIGKTQFFAQFPDPYFIDFDQGSDYYKVRKTYCPNWDSFLRLLDLLEAKPICYAQNYVIDTGYLMYERIHEYIVRTLALDDIRDDAWGNGYKKIEREFRLHNERLRALGGYCVIAHTDISEIKKRDGSSITKHVVQLSKAAHKWFAGFVNILAYYDYDALGDRIIRLRGDLELEAGVRGESFENGGHFYYTDGSPIKKISAGNNAKEAYDNFVLAFENKLINNEGGSIAIAKKKIPLKKAI